MSSVFLPAHYDELFPCINISIEANDVSIKKKKYSSRLHLSSYTLSDVVSSIRCCGGNAMGLTILYENWKLLWREEKPANIVDKNCINTN